MKIFNWTGTCTGGCLGQATLRVETSDSYVQGTISTQHSDLLQALYQDSQISIDYAPFFNSPSGYNFQIPGLGNTSFIFIEAVGFKEFPDGTWRSGGEGLAPNCDVANPPGTNVLCGYRATGTNGVWSQQLDLHYATPSPESLTMLLIGCLVWFITRRIKL